jgi:hypothetical protein
MKFFTWRNAPRWIAVAHANTVAEARRLLLDGEDVGGIDGSCVVRAKAREIISNEAPEMFIGANAEFALTGSAEVEEQEAYTRSLRAELEAMRERTELAEVESATHEKSLYTMREERDALAARLLAVKQWAVNWQAVYPHITLPDVKDGETILSFRDASQRKQGAIWALNQCILGHYRDTLYNFIYDLKNGVAEVPDDN